MFKRIYKAFFAKEYYVVERPNMADWMTFDPTDAYNTAVHCNQKSYRRYTWHRKSGSWKEEVLEVLRHYTYKYQTYPFDPTIRKFMVLAKTPEEADELARQRFKQLFDLKFTVMDVFYRDY